MEKRDLDYVMDAHSNHPREPSKAFRKFDGKTPYYIHPIWCATMIGTETELDTTVRVEGVQTLLYHDILEDTTKQLPDWLSPRVKELVGHMTYPGGSEQEFRELWDKPIEVKLYKLYDKTNNLFAFHAFMAPEKLKRHYDHTRRLCDEVERAYSGLHIAKLARAVLR